MGHPSRRMPRHSRPRRRRPPRRHPPHGRAGRVRRHQAQLSRPVGVFRGRRRGRVRLLGRPAAGPRLRGWHGSGAAVREPLAHRRRAGVRGARHRPARARSGQGHRRLRARHRLGRAPRPRADARGPQPRAARSGRLSLRARQPRMGHRGRAGMDDRPRRDVGGGRGAAHPRVCQLCRPHRARCAVGYMRRQRAAASAKK